MTVTPYYDHAGVVIYHGDCREVLPALALPSSTVTVTDPPYGTGGWRRPEAGQGSNPKARLEREAWDDGEVDWLALCGDVVMTFWPAARTSLLLNAANVAGLTKHRAVYLHKPDPKPQVGGRIRWSVEPVWVLSGEGFTLHGGDDVWEASTPRLGRDTEATGHPYQKPLDFMRWLLLKTECAPVLDPYMGSGTTLVAAKQLGRPCIGIELSERYCEIAATRLSQEVLPLDTAA